MTGKPMELDFLSYRVVRLLADGRLPWRRNPDLSAGYGHDLPCDLCEETITPDQIQYDIVDDVGSILHLHLGCHHLWQGSLEDFHAMDRG